MSIFDQSFKSPVIIDDDVRPLRRTQRKLTRIAIDEELEVGAFAIELHSIKVTPFYRDGYSPSTKLLEITWLVRERDGGGETQVFSSHAFDAAHMRPITVVRDLMMQMFHHELDEHLYLNGVRIDPHTRDR